MKWYGDILTKRLELTTHADINYHKWTPKSISKFWQLQTRSLIVEQFYPEEYWIDFISWAKKLITNPIKKAVDVGCGNGNFLKILNEYYPNANKIGVDLSNESLEFPINRFKDNKSIQFVVGSATKLDFDESTIDLITMTEVLEHLYIDDFSKAFTEISRVLKPGGHFLATVPFDEKLSFVGCPDCASVFQPYQHMIFEISHADIINICQKNGMVVVRFFETYNTQMGKSKIYNFIKTILFLVLPLKLLIRLFPKPGATGFLARKI